MKVLLALMLALALTSLLVGCVALTSPTGQGPVQQALGSITAQGPITGTTASLTGRVTAAGLTSSAVITGTSAVLTDTLSVTGRTTTGGLTSSATITGTSAVFTDTLDVQSTLSVQRRMIAAQTTITATEGMTITPEYNTYKLNSAAPVTITLNACTGLGGMLLNLYGLDANTITVADSNIRTTDGNAATLGQYDVIQWLCTGADWAHVAKSANQ